MLNMNPETVSTDFDESSALYLDEVSLERVRDVAAMEAVVGGPPGLLVGLGGQGPNTIARALQGEGGEGAVLGTAVGDIAMAEDRGRHAALLARLGVGQPRWTTQWKVDLFTSS